MGTTVLQHALGATPARASSARPPLSRLQEYGHEDKIKGLIEHFSLFTQYPIKLLMEKEVGLVE